MDSSTELRHSARSGGTPLPSSCLLGGGGRVRFCSSEYSFLVELFGSGKGGGRYGNAQRWNLHLVFHRDFSSGEWGHDYERRNLANYQSPRARQAGGLVSIPCQCVVGCALADSGAGLLHQVLPPSQC